MGYECAVLQLNEDGWERVYEEKMFAVDEPHAARMAVVAAAIENRVTVKLVEILSAEAGVRVLVRGPDGGAPRGYEVLLTLAVSAGVQVDDSATKTLRKAARWDL